MKRLGRTVLTALFFGLTLTWSLGCSRGDSAPVLRGSEVVLRVRRTADPLLLRVELQEGQRPGDVHAEGWYVSAAQMSRIFEALKSPAP